MLKRNQGIVRLALVLGDALGTALALTAAYLIRFHSGWIPSKSAGAEAPYEAYAAALPVIVITCLLAYHLTGLYEPRRTSGFLSELFDIAKGTVSGLFMVVALTFFIRSPAESRTVLGLFAALNPVGLAIFRGAIRSVLWNARRRGFNRRYAVIVGTGKLGQRVAEKIVKNSWTGIELVGFVEARENAARERVRDVPVIGRIDDLPRIVRGRELDQVFVALPFDQARTIRRVADTLEREAIAVTLVPDIYEFVTMRSSVADFDGLPIIHLRDRPIDEASLVLKRVIDVVVAAVGLVLVGPIMIALAIVVWATDGRPIFYRQERMGLDGRRFDMLKFRTMRRDAEAATGAVWAKENDPRVTRVGRFLRRTSLDELPQLLNVLRGQMSIVGPRPERPVLIDEFKRKIPRYMLRHAIKAGITGWAQVNGWRGDTSLKKRIQYDLYYIENWSILFDVKIILLTFVRGFYHPHAY